MLSSAHGKISVIVGDVFRAQELGLESRIERMAVMLIQELHLHVDEQVTVKGWVVHHRSSGKIDFLVIRDGSGQVQTVVREPARTALAEVLTQAVQETSVVVEGRVGIDPRSPGGVEVVVEQIQLIGSGHDYPIGPKAHGVDFLMDHRHLWVRSARQSAILRIRAAIIRLARNFLDGHGFVVADPPIITPSFAEGSTSLFAIDYFGEPAYLSQSGQLYMEALAMALGKVYAFGPTFRAEKSKTRRHLSEFWMIEPEMAFCDFEENLWWQEQLIEAIVQGVLAECQVELATLERDLSHLQAVVRPFPRITYRQALEQLTAEGFELQFGDDLGAPHETALARAYDRPVFLTHFPTRLKAFYMQPDPRDPELALAADLLAPEGYGEIIGGSERIYDYELMRSRLVSQGLDEGQYAWYLDLRRFGTVPHSGFGVGLERLVAWIAGLDHVRETTPFPRTLTRLWP